MVLPLLLLSDNMLGLLQPKSQVPSPLNLQLHHLRKKHLQISQ
jgi:hypothetical protein